MREIEPIGSYFPMDEDGFILNPTHWNKIEADWTLVIHEIVEAYHLNIGEALKAIYVRGSVAKGEAVKGFSDIDMFALVKPNFSEKPIRWKTADFQKVLEQQLQRKYSFVKAIECNIATYQTAFLTSNLAMVIQTQSLCVWGEDVSSLIPPYQPNEQLRLNSKWLKEDIQAFKNLSTVAYQPEDGQAMLKILLRVGFELVMPQVGKFTNDLYLCYRDFSIYYPKYEADMRQCLFWYLNPPSQKQDLEKVVYRIGAFLSEKVYTKA